MTEQLLYPLITEAREAHEQELKGIRRTGLQERAMFWERYTALGEEVIFRGLTEDRLNELGAKIRDGLTLSHVALAVSVGRRSGLGSTGQEIEGIRNELQKIIAFTNPPIQ